MTIEIKVPVLPESVADAVLLDWNKQMGDAVSRDEILVEVETDKVVLEVLAPQDGVLTQILAQSGETVLSEQLLAKMSKVEVVEEKNETSDGIVGELSEQSKVSNTSPPVLGPAARRMVAEHGINPEEINATGPGGLLTKEDVLNHITKEVRTYSNTQLPLQSYQEKEKIAPDPRLTSRETIQEPPRSGMSVQSIDRVELREPMSRLRQTIASRLVKSQQTAALLTTFSEVNMQPVIALRSKYKEVFEKKHGAKLGFMSFFVKASVAALQKFPLVNAYIDGIDIVKHNYNDIGIAVSSQRGLVVPILRNCEKLCFSDIEFQIQDFGSKVRNGKINLQDLSGGTFTITNGGVFGSMLSTPIVNPPQSAILGMHKIQERPMAEEGRVVVRPMMYLALSYDHRIIDGKEAVQFLVMIKDILEDPTRLLLDC